MTRTEKGFLTLLRCGDSIFTEREKRLKAWNRQWKLRLIEEMNPEWNDLYDELVE